MIIHVVQRGDTLYKIAQNYGVSIDKLVQDNQLTYPNNLVVGQDIVVDVNTMQHTVLSGETLWKIANNYGVSLQSLIQANPQISNPDNIQVGQVINIPSSMQQQTPIEVNGYAIANISQTVLEQTLPNLTYLSIFSYQVKPDGSLYILYEQNLINTARRYNVAPVMVVTNIGTSGGFDSDLAHTILTNMQAQNILINNIIQTLQRKNYYGVDIDFEYIYPEDRQNYVNFLQNLKNQLEPLGYYLSVAVAPKYRSNQSGILYEAHDYEQIGRIADRVIIMTYEWGYMYGPPMAVAPYSEVRSVIEYATSVIEPSKILMGMPNYAYDWTLPYVQGTPARALTNNAALNLAITKGSEIKFDERAQAPYFNYTDNSGRQHIVWFENARSVQARLQLVKDFNLAGISYWTINNFWNVGYIVLNNMFDVIKLLP